MACFSRGFTVCAVPNEKCVVARLFSNHHVCLNQSCVCDSSQVHSERHNNTFADTTQRYCIENFSSGSCDLLFFFFRLAVFINDEGENKKTFLNDSAFIILHLFIHFLMLVRVLRLPVFSHCMHSFSYFFSLYFTN